MIDRKGPLWGMLVERFGADVVEKLDALAGDHKKVREYLRSCGWEDHGTQGGPWRSPELDYAPERRNAYSPGIIALGLALEMKQRSPRSSAAGEGGQAFGSTR